MWDGQKSTRTSLPWVKINSLTLCNIIVHREPDCLGNLQSITLVHYIDYIMSFWPFEQAVATSLDAIVR